MKKHLGLFILFAFAAAITAQAQSLTYSGSQKPAETVQKVRQVAEQSLGVFKNRDDDSDRGYCDCDKCQKHKKSKKHHGCNQRGNHYGKHKNHQNKHSCSCDHHSCESGKKHDRDDDDRRYDRNRRGRDDDRNGWNGRDRDDDRYGRNGRDRDDEYRTQPSQRKPTSTAKVKTRPSPTAKPAPSRPGAKKTVAKRPIGVKQ